MEYDGIVTAKLTSDEIITALEKEKTLILATCTENHVTIRHMSHVNDGLTIYFQTGRDYLKTKQIIANPCVALSIGTYDIEGKAEIIGHPKENPLFVEKMKSKHPDAFERWSSLEDEVVIRVEIERVRQWMYVDNQPILAQFDSKQL